MILKYRPSCITFARNRRSKAFLLVPRLFWCAAVSGFLLSAQSCIRERGESAWQLSETHEVVLLDSLQAADAIIKDTTDHFFEQVEALDMSLQMHRVITDSIPRVEVLEAYKLWLRQEVTDFSAQEKALLHDVMEEVAVLCNSISVQLLPPHLELLKIKGLSYGNGAYYTRENRILLPADQLKEENREELLKIMLHELFHVYSRYHPRQREKLYGLIGFHLLDNQVVMNDSLRIRRLLNPDGIRNNYAVRLRTPWSQAIDAVPVLFAKEWSYRPETPNFFDYLQFELFIAIKQEDGVYWLRSRSDGSPPFSLLDQADFYRQIGDNTKYIIHPDEIMADNFSLLALSKSKRSEYQLSRRSSAGRKLLQDIERVLKARSTIGNI